MVTVTKSILPLAHLQTQMIGYFSIRGYVVVNHSEIKGALIPLLKRKIMERSKSILVVEDQLLVALDFENQLESFGYSPINNAADYRQAIKKINDTKPDLILLDIMLKDGPTGFNIAKVAREKNIPFVFVTASTHTSFFKRAEKYHPEAILHKPVDMQELRKTVDKLFN